MGRNQLLASTACFSCYPKCPCSLQGMGSGLSLLKWGGEATYQVPQLSSSCFPMLLRRGEVAFTHRIVSFSSCRWVIISRKEKAFTLYMT